MPRVADDPRSIGLSPFYTLALTSAILALLAWASGWALAWMWPQFKFWPLSAAMLGWLASAPLLASQPQSDAQQALKRPRAPMNDRRLRDSCAAVAGLTVFAAESLVSGYWRGLATMAAGVLLPALVSMFLARLEAWRPSGSDGGRQLRMLAAAILSAPAATLLRHLGPSGALPHPLLYVDRLFGALLAAAIVAPLFAELARSTVGRIMGRVNPANLGPGHAESGALTQSEQRAAPTLLRPLLAPILGLILLTWATSIARHGGQPDLARLIAMAYPLLGMLITRQAPNAIGAILMSVNSLAMTLNFMTPNLIFRFGTPAELREMVSLLLLVGVFSLQAVVHAVSHDSYETARALVRRALHSDLSGLPNQRALARIIGAMLSNPRRRTFWVVGAVLPDIARWSDLTDSGSAEALERAVALRLKAQFEPIGTRIAHPASGRFVMMVGDRTDGLGIRQRLNAALSGQRFDTGQQSIQLRFHAGIVEVPAQNAVSADGVLTALSMALQRAANDPAGIHRVTASHALVHSYRTELKKVEMVSRALNEGRIRLFAERIEPTSDARGRLHYEVLVRVLDDTGAILEPKQFMPAIWHASLFSKLDRLVFIRTVAMLASHPKLHNATSLCSINVFGPTLCDPEFPDYVRRCLKTHSVDPGRLMIEITESSTIADLELARQHVARLSELGLLIALDDFGTGLATFDYLKKLRADVLKIDGAFVRQICDNSLDREIVAAIVRIARATGARTVAEWIETPAQRDLATELGVDYLQGHLIAVPVPIESLELPATTGVIDLTMTGALNMAKLNGTLDRRLGPQRRLSPRVL